MEKTIKLLREIELNVDNELDKTYAKYQQLTNKYSIQDRGLKMNIAVERCMRKKQDIRMIRFKIKELEFLIEKYKSEYYSNES